MIDASAKVYLAAVALQTFGRDGQTRTIAPGKPVDDFETWPYDNQLSLLRLGHVKLVGGKHTANLTTQGGYLHFETLAPPAVADSCAPAPGALGPLDADALPDDGDIEMPDAQPLPPEASVATGASAAVSKAKLQCPDCHKMCNGVRGLVLHRAKSHAGAA